MKFGIEDIHFEAPSLYLPVEKLAMARRIEPAKLRHGLGLEDMAICDVDEDVITLGAKAVIKIIERNQINLNTIGRLYIGTESGIDGSKPLATYILGLVEKYFQNKVSDQHLRHCDAVDLTFACIGGVDAMLNTLNWLRTEPEQVAIVVACDNALYDLDSTGEYTQGAGAAAVLLKAEPNLMIINSEVGVACADEHDFFKPLHSHTVTNSIANILRTEGKTFKEYRETPVFDGQYSNYTYGKRISEAWNHYASKQLKETRLEDYSKYIFHLPYAYHGRRIFADLYFGELKKKGELEAALQAQGISIPSTEATKDELRAFTKAKTKSDLYQEIIKHKIAPSEILSGKIGNVYTASIFLALISTLIHSTKDSLNNKNILFIAYGSGSKSKIFSGLLQSNWSTKISKWDYDATMKNRTQISFDQYEALRKQEITTPISSPKQLRQESTGVLQTNRYARYYGLS